MLLVDEAHRSHTNTLHTRLTAALPNAAKIGFTGTPILQQDKKQTHQTFGPFIDAYKIDQSQQDGATVRILYEGRTVEGVVKNGETLDALFDETFKDRTGEEIRDIREQYVTTVMPDGFKGQVVAVSRRGADRYQRALLKAKQELVRELEQLARSGRREPQELVAVLLIPTDLTHRPLWATNYAPSALCASS